jgi:hypothetical protein
VVLSVLLPEYVELVSWSSLESEFTELVSDSLSQVEETFESELVLELLLLPSFWLRSEEIERAMLVLWW